MEASQSKSPLLACFFIQMKDLRQTSEYTQYMRLLGWDVAQAKNAAGSKQHVYIRRVPLLGYVAKLQRPNGKITAEEIDKIARQYRVAALYIEPMLHDPYYISHGFAPAKSSFLPAKTIQIDLAKSEKDLLSEMHPKTRYNIKVAQKRGVEINESRDIESFVTLWHSSARRRGMFLSQKKEIEAIFYAFGPKAILLLAYATDSLSHVTYIDICNMTQPVAGVLMIKTNTTAYYMYAASTKKGNRLFAPTLIAWEAIRLAKSSKCKIFDFEGIYDERYPQTKNWKGFTKFKEGFGGKVITHPQTLVKYYNPLAKLLRL